MSNNFTPEQIASTLMEARSMVASGIRSNPNAPGNVNRSALIAIIAHLQTQLENATNVERIWSEQQIKDGAEIVVLRAAVARVRAIKPFPKDSRDEQGFERGYNAALGHVREALSREESP